MINMIEILKKHENEATNFGYKQENSITVRLYGRRYFVFLHDDEIRFFVRPPFKKEVESGRQCSEKYSKYSFPLFDVIYFSREGEVYTETKITGGGGGGSNLGDAIIGGIVAGAPGAIIASRGKNNPVKSETITHDTRRTILVCKNKKLSFSPDDYSAFMQLIPDKELSVVQQRKATEAVPPTEKSPSDRLKELKDLLNNELISQDEYDNKRAEILEKI